MFYTVSCNVGSELETAKQGESQDLSAFLTCQSPHKTGLGAGWGAGGLHGKRPCWQRSPWTGVSRRPESRVPRPHSSVQGFVFLVLSFVVRSQRGDGAAILPVTEALIPCPVGRHPCRRGDPGLLWPTSQKSIPRAEQGFWKLRDSQPQALCHGPWCTGHLKLLPTVLPQHPPSHALAALKTLDQVSICPDLGLPAQLTRQAPRRK